MGIGKLKIDGKVIEREDRAVFVDIDGTMTKAAVKNAEPNPEMIEAVRRLISMRKVIIWSGCGVEYARAFCKRHGLQPSMILGKPEYCVDDVTPTTCLGITVLTPAAFLKHMEAGTAPPHRMI